MHRIDSWNCIKRGLFITKMKTFIFTFLDLLLCRIFYNYFVFRPSSFTNFSLLIPYFYFLGVNTNWKIIQILEEPSSLCWRPPLNNDLMSATTTRNSASRQRPLFFWTHRWSLYSGLTVQVPLKTLWCAI